MADRNGDLSPLYPDMEALRKSHFLQESIRTTGAAVMGRRTYDLGLGDLSDYEYQVPIFVVTHHPPAEGPKGQNDRLKVYFVTEGIEEAIRRAREAAGEKDVTTIGGADISHQILEKGLADELSIGIAPILLGEGLKFFEGLDLGEMKLEKIDEEEAAETTYLLYRIIKT
jgi:dihydrofolate reductase